MGDFASIGAIRQEDLIKAYKDFISPDGASMAMVGDLSKYDNLPDLLHKTLAQWSLKPVSEIQFPAINQHVEGIITFPINRDQIVLGYAAPSISRLDESFDKVLLFDQLFTGGVLGSMSSRLFELREQSGLFYTIGGSLLAGADEQPGMVFIKTIVSIDRLVEAQDAIENTIEHATQGITNDELQEAKLALINSLVDNFATNKSIAHAFLFLHRFDFQADYFDHRAQQLDAIKLETIAPTVKKILNRNNLVKIMIGRTEAITLYGT